MNVKKRSSHSERFLHALEPYAKIVIIAHNHPDPDAISSGWGLSYLIIEKLQKSVQLMAGGAIIRAENQHLMSLLKPPITLITDYHHDPNTAIVMVDCSPSATNHILTGSTIKPIAVIDHHEVNQRQRLSYKDYRHNVVATASIVASYLHEQNLPPHMNLASALLYAISSESCGGETNFSALDRSMIVWLTTHSNPAYIAEINNAPLERHYYTDMVLAMQNTFIYDDTALSLMPNATGPETVAEVADLLIRCQGIRRVLCGAAIGDKIFFSVRNQIESSNAADLIVATLQGIGTGGGHVRRAGGLIEGLEPANQISDKMQTELRQRWLTACSINGQRGQRLIARRDIMTNL